MGITVEVCRLESIVPVRWASRETILTPAGSTIAHLAPDEIADGTWSCILNGKTYYDSEWDLIEVSDGSQLIYSPMPENLAAIGKFLLKAIGYLLLSYATSVIAAKIIGKPDTETFEDTDTMYVFNSLQNKASPGIPIQIAVGTTPVAGNIIEMDLVGTGTTNLYGSSLDMTIGLCEGPIQSINSVTVNGNDIDDLASLGSYTYNLGTNTQASLGSVGTTTLQNVGLDLAPVAPIVAAVYTMARTDTTDPNDPNDVYAGWSNGRPAAGSTLITPSLNGTNAFTGIATVHSAGAPEPDGQGTQPDHFVRFYNVSEGGTLDQAFTGTGTLGVVEGFTSSGETTRLNVNLATGASQNYVVGTLPGERIRYTTTTDVDQVRINILFPNGLYNSTNNGLQQRTAQYGYRYRNTAEVDTFGDPIEVWSNDHFVTIVEEHVGAWLHTHPVVLDNSAGNEPDRGTYEFEIWDNLSQSDEDGYKMRVDSVVEIQNQIYSYPNVATLKVDINSDSAINGSAIPNVVATVTGLQTEKWDGVSTSAPNYVLDSPNFSNPAWQVLTLLRNTRFGLGNYIDESKIDLPSFLEWANWCDEIVSDGKGGSEVRCQFDGVFDKSTPVWDAIQRICQTARASIYTVGETIKVKHERARTPVQLFTEGNIVAGSLNMGYTSRLERPTRVNVRMVSAENNYQIDVVGVDDPDALTAQLPQRILNVDMPGITRISQALREARFRLNLEKLGRVVSWDCSVDSLAAEPGDLVLLSSSVIGVGESGRVTGAGSGSNTLTLDRDVILVDGETYNVVVRHDADDVRDTRQITSAAGTYNAGTELSVDANWSRTLTADCLYTLGPLNTHSKQVVISSIRTNGNLDRSIEGVVYNADIHEDDITTAASTFVELPEPKSIPTGGVTNLTVRELITPDVQAAVAWQYPDGQIGSAQIWVRDSGQSQYFLRDTVQWPQSQTILRFNTSPALSNQPTYEIVVVPVSTQGAALPPTSFNPVTFTPTGTHVSPEAPTNGTLKQDDDLLKLTWDSPQNTQISRFEVRRGLHWVGSQPVGFTVDPEIVTEQWCPTLTSGVTEKYFVRAVTPGGQYGQCLEFTEAQSLDSWLGNTATVTDIKANGSWTGVSFSSTSRDSDGNIILSTPGTIGKFQTSDIVMGSNSKYRIGAIVHCVLEDDTWASANYVWNSQRTWNGYVNPRNWRTVVSLNFRTRTSSSGAYTDWKPLTTRTVSTAFERIQIQGVITPADSSQNVTVNELVLVVESLT